MLQFPITQTTGGNTVEINPNPNLFGPPKDDEVIPEPGTKGNQWVGVDPESGEGVPWSGAQRRRVRRAIGRRQAAEIRVNTKTYAAGQKQRARYEALANRRAAVLTGQVEVSDHLLNNAVNDQARRAAVSRSFDTKAARDQAAADRREDRLDERRIARFKAGKPRGKDLREETFKQYSSFLPKSYWRTDKPRVTSPRRKG